MPPHYHGIWDQKFFVGLYSGSSPQDIFRACRWRAVLFSSKPSAVFNVFRFDLRGPMQGNQPGLIQVEQGGGLHIFDQEVGVRQYQRRLQCFRDQNKPIERAVSKRLALSLCCASLLAFETRERLGSSSRDPERAS